MATGASGRMRIEYIQGRRALRLTAEDGHGPVEVPLASLIERLEIDRRDLAAQPRLLLFAGRHDRPRGGAGDLIGWFESADDARAAFREVRRSRTDEEGWAELVALDRGGRPAVLAWFGRTSVDRRPKARRLWAVPARGHHPAGRGSRQHLRLLVR